MLGLISERRRWIRDKKTVSFQSDKWGNKMKNGRTRDQARRISVVRPSVSFLVMPRRSELGGPRIPRLSCAAHVVMLTKPPPLTRRSGLHSSAENARGCGYGTMGMGEQNETAAAAAAAGLLRRGICIHLLNRQSLGLRSSILARFALFTVT